MLLSVECAACGRPGRSPCPGCIAALAPSPPLPPPLGIDEVVTLFDFDEPGRSLVHAMKYRNSRATSRWMADRLAPLVRVSGASAASRCVTWIPTSAERRRERGFDQAERLARQLARRLGEPARRLLRRHPGPPQTGRTLVERWSGPDFSPARTPLPPRLVLVDDVVTTGATAMAAASVLRRGGVGHILLVTVSRTPLKRRRPSADVVSDAGDQHSGCSHVGGTRSRPRARGNR